MPQPNAVKFLVVDEEPSLRRVLVRLLEGEGFTCAEAGSGTEAREMMHHDPVPLVISDLRMPQMDGVTLLREILARWPDTAVLVVTAVAEVESAVACLQLGALDYVAKPFHLDEVRARVMQALDKRRLILENRMYHQQLEAEYRHIMEHPVIGARILGPLMRDAPAALAIVRSHHERLDGKGFPDGLVGDAIPLEVRVVTVADSFDAMTSVRPYRPALSVQKAMQELEEMKGVQFDPQAVEAFLAAFPRAALPVPTPEARPLHLPARSVEAPRT